MAKRFVLMSMYLQTVIFQGESGVFFDVHLIIVDYVTGKIYYKFHTCMITVALIKSHISAKYE